MPFFPYQGTVSGLPDPLDGGTMTMGFNVEVDGKVVMPNIVTAANDTAAAIAGVGPHEIYWNGTACVVRGA